MRRLLPELSALRRTLARPPTTRLPRTELVLSLRLVLRDRARPMAPRRLAARLRAAAQRRTLRAAELTTSQLRRVRFPVTRPAMEQALGATDTTASGSLNASANLSSNSGVTASKSASDNFATDLTASKSGSDNFATNKTSSSAVADQFATNQQAAENASDNFATNKSSSFGAQQSQQAAVNSASQVAESFEQFEEHGGSLRQTTSLRLTT